MNHKVSKALVGDIGKACELTGMLKDAGVTTDELIDAMVEGVTRFENFSKVNKFPIPLIIVGMLFEGPEDPNYEIIKRVFKLDKYMVDEYYGLISLNVGFTKDGRMKPGKYVNLYIFESIDAFDGIGNDIISMCGDKYTPAIGVDDYTLGKLVFGRLMKARTFTQTLLHLFSRTSVYYRVLKQLCKEKYIEKVM